MHATSPPTRQQGFSLIELLIVVAIIGIVSAIAIPSYLASQQAAHASAAVQSMRLIHSCQASYHTSKGQYTDLATLSADRYFDDPLLAAGYKSKYNFILTVDAADPAKNYEAIGTPGPSPTRWRHFYVDGTGMLRFSEGSPAGAASAPLN